MSAVISSGGRTCEKQTFHMWCTACPAHWYQDCPRGSEYKTWRSCGWGWGCKTECVIKVKEECTLPCGKPCPKPTWFPSSKPTRPTYKPTILTRIPTPNPTNSPTPTPLPTSSPTDVTSETSESIFSDKEDSCKAIAVELGLPYSAQYTSNGAPAGCIKYDDGRVIYVKNCINHPNCGTTQCNGCTVMDSEERCKAIAGLLGLPFSAQHKSNGAPAGCMRYNDGRVIYVRNCINHPNCGTSHCNGCSVLDMTYVTPKERCQAKAVQLGLPFASTHKSNGAPAGCMRYNDGRVIYVENCINHPNCGTQRCNGCSILDITSI